MNNTIDLSQLPAPEVIESLDFEVVLDELKSDLIDRMPPDDRDAISDTLDMESEPLTKLLEVVAYREIILRQRVNESARAVMLAFASGSDLDQIGANYNVVRLKGESDTDFRSRVQMSFESYSTAGSRGSYAFHGRSADPDVKDIQITSPSEGEVDVYVLSRAGNGYPSASLVGTVTDALSADTVRPLTDKVTVHPAEIVTYTVEATLFVLPGPDQESIRDSAAEALQKMTDEKHRIGARVSLAAIYSALYRNGVEYVELSTPTEDIVATGTQAPFCNGFDIDTQEAA
ncbi:MAG: baseplate J/gp47 family protein [Pseudohongiellaceae bacterium]